MHQGRIGECSSRGSGSSQDVVGRVTRLNGWGSLLQWTETVEGIWYPRGGFHKVSLGSKRQKILPESERLIVTIA